MIDLKPFYDKVVAKDAVVKQLAADLAAALDDETEGGEQTVVGLREELDTAQAALDEANADYERVKNADRPNDVLQNFVPVSDTEVEPEDGAQPSTISRQAFNALDATKRYEFIHSGGKVED